jgi:hypothetical protein
MNAYERQLDTQLARTITLAQLMKSLLEPKALQTRWDR